MKSDKTNFDQLDLKCLSELPIILDVLSSTGNKIGRIFKPLIEEANKSIKSNLPKNWTIDSNQSYDLLFFPFVGYSQKKMSIETLENEFKIESCFYICKKTKNRHTNWLWIYFGYNFSNSEDESENHYYFSIAGDAYEKSEKVINSNEFYETISKKNKIFELDIDHPERGDTYEAIDVKVMEHDMIKIKAGFDFFKNEILIPTLKNIK